MAKAKWKSRGAASAGGRPSTKAKAPRVTLERAESIVDWGYAPMSKRSAAAKAYAALVDLRTFGPGGELEDCFCNNPVSRFVEAARFASLAPLATKLAALQRRVPGKTWATRNRQLDRDGAAGLVAEIEEWSTANNDKLTVAAARIAIAEGWVTDDVDTPRALSKRKATADHEGWTLVKAVQYERVAGATYFLDRAGDVSSKQPVPGGVRNKKIVRLGIRREDGWTYTLFDDGVYRTEAAWVEHG